MLPLWLFVTGALSQQCTIPMSKILASYDFTEYQRTGNLNADADSGQGSYKWPFAAPHEWLTTTNGLHVKNGGSVDFSGVHDMSALTSFSLEIWTRCAKANRILSLFSKSTQTLDSGCTDARFLSMTQGPESENMLVEVGASGSCLSSFSNVPKTNRFVDGQYFGLPPRSMHSFVRHIIVTVDNQGVPLGQPGHTTGSFMLKIYVDGQLAGFSDIGGIFLQQLVDTSALPSVGWDQVAIKIAPDSNWEGYLYKLALYNESFDDATVRSIFDNCRINNPPYSPSFTQYIDEDTLADIKLNDLDATSPPKNPGLPSLADQQPYLQLSPYKSDIPFQPFTVDPAKTDPTLRIVGETYEQLGTKVYDLEGGDENNKYTFRITKMPTKSSTFSYQGSAVQLNVSMGPVDSLTLKYQAMPNEQSWSYLIGDNTWSRTEYDSFEYQTFDGESWGKAATVSIGIDPRPDPPSGSDATRSVPAGSRAKIDLLDETTTMDTFPGTTNLKVNQAIVTVLPAEGNLTVCITNNCACDEEKNAEWQPVQINAILTGQNNKPPCLRYVAKDADAQMGGGNNILATDSFKYKVLYGDDTRQTIFVESARIGSEINVAIDIVNPFYPRGNAPFGTNPEECELVEDEKKTVRIDYNTPDSYTGPMKFEIKPLPEDFKGNLYVTDEQGNEEIWNAQNRGTTKIISAGALQYEPIPEEYTKLTKRELDGEGLEPGYHFNFILVATINGEELKSIEGTQKLCVAPRNDLPEIKSIKLYAPKDSIRCCKGECTQDYDKSATWSVGSGQNYVEKSTLSQGLVLPSDTDVDFFLSPFDCVSFELEWDDKDNDPDAEYELRFTSIPDQKIGYYLNKDLWGDKIEFVKGNGDTDSDLRIAGKYADVKQVTKEFMKFELKEKDSTSISITITDTLNNHKIKQDSSGDSQVSLTIVSIGPAGSKDDEDDLSLSETDLLGLGIYLSAAGWFGTICGVIACCVCYCILGCVGFFKFQKNRIIKAERGKLGGMQNNFQGGLYGQGNTSVDLVKMKKHPAKNQYSTPSAATLKKM